MAFVSEAVLDAAEAATGERPPPIERMTWADALDRYGTDKPDLRFGMELVDLTEVFDGHRGEGLLVARRSRRSWCPTGAAYPRSRLDELTEQAKKAGAAGLAWFRVVDGEADRAGRAAGPAPLGAGSGARPASRRRRTGDLILAVSDEYTTACAVLGTLRVAIGAPPVGQGPHRYVWVVDFPMFEGIGADGNPQPAHHPFTMPYAEDLPLLATDPLSPCARRPTTSCSTGGSSGRGVCVSIAGTSSRRCSPRSASSPRRPRPASASCWAPSATGRRRTPASPFGVDRLAAILAGEENIREVIAYPKTQSGRRPAHRCARRRCRAASLAELGIRVVVPPPAPGRPASGEAPTRRRARRDAAVSLFADAADRRLQRQAPLAARLRPRTLDEIVGQEHLVGPGAPLRVLAESDRVGSSILWGPAGTGQDDAGPPAGRHHGQAPDHALGHRRRREGRARGPGRGRAPPGRAGPGHHALHRRGAPLLQVPAGRAAPRRRGRAGRAHRRHHGEPLLRGESAPVEPGLTVAAAPPRRRTTCAR